MTFRGFTLAELLISLAILSVLATFTIPKVLTSSQDGERIAIFKETISAINQATYEMILLGELEQYTNVRVAFQNKLNHVEYCWDATALGCWAGAVTSNQAGFIFANGASTAGYKNGHQAGTGNEWIYVDWNGPNEGPNTIGEDQISLSICYYEAAGGFTLFSSNCERQGTVVNNDAASGGNDAANLALWNEIWD